MRVLTIVEFKRYMASACILSIVIAKLRHKQKNSLVILFSNDKGEKVGFYGTILSLNLTFSV